MLGVVDLALFMAVMTASLLGSGHCAGMCGPLAMLASSGPTTARGLQRRLSLYHLGRLVGYMMAGALAGSLGSLVDFGGRFLGWQQSAAFLAGGGMLLMGAHQLYRFIRGYGPTIGHPGWIDRFLGVGFRWARRQSPELQASMIGLITIMLPCGWLYAFLITAAGSGSPWIGAAVMLAFWLGTIPALTVVTLGVRRLTGQARNYIPVITAILFISVGIYTVTYRTSFDYESLSEVRSASVDRVNQLPSEPMPCCSVE